MFNVDKVPPTIRVTHLEIFTRKQYKKLLKMANSDNEWFVIVHVIGERDYKYLPYFIKGKKSIWHTIIYTSPRDINFEF